MLAGDFENNATQSMLTEINQRFMPSKVFAFQRHHKNGCYPFELVPFLENQKAIKGKATFYACRNQTCDKPRTQIQEVIKFLDNKESSYFFLYPRCKATIAKVSEEKLILSKPAFSNSFTSPKRSGKAEILEPRYR